MSLVWPQKDPAEIITGTFGFTEEAGAAALLNGAGDITITVTLENGEDVDPTTVKNGAHQVLGQDVLQSFKAGLHECDYKLRCEARLTDGRKLVRTAILPVRNA